MGVDYLCVMQIGDIQIKHLAGNLKSKFPEISFAYLFGSASIKDVNPPSDLDIAVYLYPETITTALIADIIGTVEHHFPGFICDLTILNNAGIMIAMEAIKGKIIYIKKEERNLHAAFYSKTCRMYEDQTAWMKKQLQYRGYEVQWNN
jgi:predicted nucleotidyltransferase